MVKTPMNQHMLMKIAAYLSTKEGCKAINIGYTEAGAKATIQDAFGYQYEIEIKTSGRIRTELESL